jgi:hypothetical protein
MTPSQKTLSEFNNSSEKSLRGELSIWGYEPSEIISKGYSHKYVNEYILWRGNE